MHMHGFFVSFFFFFGGGGGGRHFLSTYQNALWTLTCSSLSNRHWWDKALDVLVICFVNKWTPILCLQVLSTSYRKNRPPFEVTSASFLIHGMLSRDGSWTGWGVASCRHQAVCLASDREMQLWQHLFSKEWEKSNPRRGQREPFPSSTSLFCPGPPQLH